MFVWIEFFCKKCEAIHRLRLELMTETACHMSNQIRRSIFRKGNITIDDIAVNSETPASKRLQHRTGGSKVYCDTETPISEIILTVREYMNQYYSVKEGTLNVEVCPA